MSEASTAAAFRVALLLILILAGGGVASGVDEMEERRREEVGLEPGMRLEATNAHLAKDLMPPEIQRHYAEGEYANDVVPWPVGEHSLGPRVEEQTRKNAATLTVDERGTIVDRTTNQQPPYIWGTPFPDVDASDPRAAIKIYWNYLYGYWWNGNSHNLVDLVWVNPRSVDRKAGQDVFFKYYDGLAPELAPEKNPQNLLMQFIAATTHPADLYGTTALSWRYRDADKRDSVWAYVPALRRIRPLSPANRSDGFLGSDMSQDDGPFFDGKPEDFEWKLVGEQEVLRLVDPFRMKADYETVTLPDGGWRGVFPEVPNLGFHDPGWKGVAWAPIIMQLARRPCWVIEATPKDKYYLYGRVQLLIDKETFQGAYNRKFSWTGELLNTLSVAAGPARPTPDGKYLFTVGVGGGAIAQIAENVKMNRATVATVEPRADIPNDRYIPLDPEFFNYQTLYRFGK